MNIEIRILNICFLFVFLTMSYSCNNDKKSNADDITKDKDNRKITAEIIEVENGWGYDIYIDGKRYIHQYLIPSVSGIHAFSSKEKALKTANLVIEKIRNNIIPPYITIKELDSLGVLN